MSKKLRILISIIAVCVFCVSAYKIVWDLYQYNVGNAAYDSIRDEAVTTEAPLEDEDALPYINVDFDALEAINPDIVAWLYIPDTPISYPILRGETNQTYLRTTYDMKPNILGSIFQDYRNGENFEDMNTVIYGHNTRNDSMFGGLKRYKEQEYADSHRDVYIIRKNEVLVYEAFSLYETLATSDTYIISFENNTVFADYLKAMSAQTVVGFDLLPDASTPVITLSTCTVGNKAKRLVLQAELMDTIPVEIDTALADEMKLTGTAPAEVE